MIDLLTAPLRLVAVEDVVYIGLPADESPLWVADLTTPIYDALVATQGAPCP